MIEALDEARGDQSWDEFIANARRTRDGAIIVPRPKIDRASARPQRRGLFGLMTRG
uniref:hypothetical protein n=1 Tax=uncultured Caulobacter sp. TaxID=158749 RepID=UPI0025CCB3FC|nr:hypothetical protein [uncultured Caulobacter sp.]